MALAGVRLAAWAMMRNVHRLANRRTRPMARGSVLAAMACLSQARAPALRCLARAAWAAWAACPRAMPHRAAGASRTLPRLLARDRPLRRSNSGARRKRRQPGVTLLARARGVRSTRPAPMRGVRLLLAAGTLLPVRR